jgi:RecA/RadA recombinase
MGRHKKSVDETVQEIEKEIKEKPPKKETEKKFISTGSTLFDLAISDQIDGGYLLGSVVNLIGDSASGKSACALTMMAEAINNPYFKSYKLIYDETEAAMNFDLEAMFGENIKRIQFIPDEEHRHEPRTIQQWHLDLLKFSKEPVLHVTDSWDGLTAEDDLKSAEKGIKKGGWKTEKAIVSSAAFPQIVGQINSSNSLALIISQTRQNLKDTFGHSPKTRSGGEALRFYAGLECWLSNSEKITEEIRGKKIETGRWVNVKITKNKVTGKRREFSFPILYDYGIDDISSCIDWLLEYKFWEKVQGGFIENDLTEKKMRESNLIKHIESNNLVYQLKEVVGKCWAIVEKELQEKFDRKPRYANFGGGTSTTPSAEEQIQHQVMVS